MNKTSASWLCLVAILFSEGVIFAQAAVSTSASATSLTSDQLSSLIQTFQQQQQSLAQSFMTLVQQGATDDQIQAWQNQNSSLLTAQQQRAQTLAASQPIVPVTYITDVDVPDDASQTMEDFLTTQAGLFNARAQLHNQQLQSTGTVNDATVNAAFQQQNAAALQAQQQRAQTLAQEAASQPLPVPPPLSIPAGTSPQMAAFLTLRDQIMRDHISLLNSLTSATAAERDAAVVQWATQNTSRLQQVQQMAQALANNNSSQ